MRTRNGRHAVFVPGDDGEGQTRITRWYDEAEGAERAFARPKARVPAQDLLPLEVLPERGRPPGARPKSLADHSRVELGPHYRRLVEGALHFQEFAELPGPTEESLRKNEERFRRERARVAVVRGMALARWPDAAEEAFRWPWSDGYEESLADAEGYRAEAARAREEGHERGEDR